MERNHRLLTLRAVLYCEVGFAERTNLTCVDSFHIARRSSMAVCDLIILGILTLIPTEPVQKIPKRMNHESSTGVWVGQLFLA